MVTIGNDTLPGTITTLESAPSVGVNVSAPGIPTIVGQAKLSNGTADSDTAYQVTRPKQARDLFGNPDESQLTRAVQDALAEGAYPVYAVAPPTVDDTQDLSGVSGQSEFTSFSPVLEVASDIEFTINSTSKTTKIYTAGDPTNRSIPADEVWINTQTGQFMADESMGSAGDEVQYTYLNYTTDTFDAINQMETENNLFLRDITDFVALVDEQGNAKDDLETHINDMEANGDFAIAIAGAGEGYVAGAVDADDQTGDYSDNYDNSRVQLISPSRDSDGNTIIGSYVGARSRIGIDSTPIFKELRTQSGLQTNLSTAQQSDLVNAQVIPIEERSGNARIVEDVTTVSDTNTTEQSWRQGISRLVTDYVAETTRAQSEGYVGEFNDRTTLNNVRGNVSSELKQLLESRQLEAYSLVVEEVDSTTIAIDIGIDTADPLRNIELTVSAGAVQNGVTVEGV